MQNIATVGLAMLSWRSPQTVVATLKNYEEEHLFSLFDQNLIFFQEISDADKAAANLYNLNYAGNRKNTGIYGGVCAILEKMHTDYVLLLENDCPLVENHDKAQQTLESALYDMQHQNINICRLRHLKYPGQKFQTLHKFLSIHERPIMRFIRPIKAQKLIGTAAYAISHPELRFPHAFYRTKNGNLITNSRHINWTNQSILVNRKWMLSFILPWVGANPSKRTVNGFSDIEKELNSSWWRNQQIPVMIADPGLFTHQRIDD